MDKTLIATTFDARNPIGPRLDADHYGQLCAETLPQVIESEEEFDRMVEHLERLTFKKTPPPRKLRLPPCSNALSWITTTSTAH